MSKYEVIVRRRAVLGLLAVLLVVCAANWSVPWFMTQDGAAHVYNAHLLLELQKPDTPLKQIYHAEWVPLPNLAGHVILMALLNVAPAWLADRLLITLTLVGLACAAYWLRVRVAGWRGGLAAVPLTILLALNWMWLMGFYNFVLGACFFALTLGCWWVWRDRMQLPAAALLTVLLLAGYFCHPFSFGMTVIGLGVLALLTPGAERWRRGWWTALSSVPLVPLVLFYRGLMQQDSAPARPKWVGMDSLWSPTDWLLRWVSTETLQLGHRKYLPFGATAAFWHNLLSPTFLAGCGVGLLVAVTLVTAWRNRATDDAQEAAQEAAQEVVLLRGWWLLALLLLAGCAFAPDEFGARHGGYLRQRLLLLALITLLPLLRFELKTRAARLGQGLIAAACLLQIAWVWDYAFSTSRLASEFYQSQQALVVQQGRGERIGTMLLPERQADGTYRRAGDTERFNVRPLLHLDNLLGAGTGHVVWNNYEAAHYFFLVKHPDPASTRLAGELDELNKRNLPSSDAAIQEYFAQWASLLERSHHKFSTLVIWGTAPELEPALKQWFLPEPVFAAGNVRVLRHR